MERQVLQCRIAKYVGSVASREGEIMTAEQDNERTRLELFLWRATAIVEIVGGLLFWWLA